MGDIGSFCKYFGWDEDKVMQMPYDKYIAYQASIPDYGDDEELNEDGTPKKPKPNEPVHKGAVNLFDLAVSKM